MAPVEARMDPVRLFPSCDPHGVARDALCLGHAWTRLVSGPDLYRAWTLSLPVGVAPGAAAAAVLLVYGRDVPGDRGDPCTRLRALLEERNDGVLRSGMLG